MWFADLCRTSGRTACWADLFRLCENHDLARWSEAASFAAALKHLKLGFWVMVKLVFCVRRRPDIGAGEFHRYWRDVHGPLVAGVAPALGIRRLRRVHTLMPLHSMTYSQLVDNRRSVSMAWPSCGSTAVMRSLPPRRLQRGQLRESCFLRTSGDSLTIRVRRCSLLKNTWSSSPSKVPPNAGNGYTASRPAAPDPKAIPRTVVLCRLGQGLLGVQGTTLSFLRIGPPLSHL